VHAKYLRQLSTSIALPLLAQLQHCQHSLVAELGCHSLCVRASVVASHECTERAESSNNHTPSTRASSARATTNGAAPRPRQGAGMCVSERAIEWIDRLIDRRRQENEGGTGYGGREPRQSRIKAWRELETLWAVRPVRFFAAARYLSLCLSLVALCRCCSSLFARHSLLLSSSLACLLARLLGARQLCVFGRVVDRERLCSFSLRRRLLSPVANHPSRFVRSFRWLVGSTIDSER